MSKPSAELEGKFVRGIGHLKLFTSNEVASKVQAAALKKLGLMFLVSMITFEIEGLYGTLP